MELRVATYNIYARPRKLFWDNQVQRAKNIGKVISKYEKENKLKIDVLCLQEVVDSKVHKIIKTELRKIGFLFQTKRIDKRYRMNGGIITYSRYPIVKEDKIIFNFEDLTIWNATAAKGCVFAKVLKDKKYHNIMNLHLDSFDSKLRKEQMINLDKWINNRNIPDDETIIICGDFNIDYHGYKDEFKNVEQAFEYNVPEFDKSNAKYKWSLDNHNDWIVRRKGKRKKGGILIDYFIYDGDDVKETTMEVVPLKLKQTVRKILLSTKIFFNIASPYKSYKVDDFSDHYMVMCVFKM